MRDGRWLLLRKRTFAWLCRRLLETTEVVQVFGPAGMRYGLEKAVSSSAVVPSATGLAGVIPADQQKLQSLNSS